MYFTFSESPKTAAATARQTLTSSPFHFPWLSAEAKPGADVFTPHCTKPRDFTASRTAPAWEGSDQESKAALTAPNTAIFFIMMVLSFCFEWGFGDKTSVLTVYTEPPSSLRRASRK